MKEHTWVGSGLAWRCTGCGTTAASTQKPEYHGEMIRVGIGSCIDGQMVTSCTLDFVAKSFQDCDLERVRLFSQSGALAWGKRATGKG